jgi:ribosome-associated protein
MICVEPGIRIPFSELECSYCRSTGPGGQNVNKVNSKCVLRWDLLNSSGIPPAARSRFQAQFANHLTNDGVLVMSSDRFRDQRRNFEDCIEKLTAMLEKIAVPPKPRTRTRPTRGSVRRRRQDKEANSVVKKARRRPDSD